MRQPRFESESHIQHPIVENYKDNNAHEVEKKDISSVDSVLPVTQAGRPVSTQKD